MYGIYQKYYANTRYEIFERNFLKKLVYFLLLNPRINKLSASRTVMERDFVVNGKARTCFF